MRLTRVASLLLALSAAVMTCVVGPSLLEAPLARRFERLPDLVPPALADNAAAADKVVARVGESTITVAELEKRMSEAPRSFLAKLGSTPDEIRKNFLEQVVVRDAILAEEARARGLDQQRDVRDRVRGALRAMILHDAGAGAKPEDITDEEVRAHFEANKGKFAVPQRIGIFRILVGSEAEAKSILAELGGSPDPKKWNDLARDKSLDKSNHLRGGNLGLVAEDGSTGQAENRVDPALYKAALAVKDGTMVPQPVKEGDRWAVVWKRQSMSQSSRSLELEAPTIRAAIADERKRTAVQALLEKLRPELIKELNVELCDMVTVTAAGELQRAQRPGVLPRSKRAATASPDENQPGGLR
ncbi:MAG: peptidyl-prolyl cis-trans isomerase [Polyangiaceae bacterium]|nr:peptidyl-prolyl cis-trans isomerase [Polyangiaceae bacterium]MBK8941169.1 peptidyl-prolyl cis-trans isomerase [Polyangiaceae bacterium]